MRELKYISTVLRNGKKQVLEGKAKLEADDGTENQAVCLFPQMRYQKMGGFGGAVTDSAGYIYSLMNEEQRAEVIQNYFGEENMNYTRVRIPVDSCDFSLEHYEASSKENQEGFNLERPGKYLLPLLRDIQNAAGDKLEVMMTPWSPPAFMKTNGRRNGGGRLKQEYRKQWAEYICRYLEEFRGMGFRVTSLSIQNEPKAVQTWDSCIYTAQEEKEFLKSCLYPAMESRGLGDVGIFIWDHNKERAFERACGTIDSDTDSMIAGVAVHWYSGDHFEQLQMIRDRFPDKEIILSEACIEYSKYGAGNELFNAQKYAHDIIGDMNHGLNTFYDWNLLLDEMGGPNHAGNYCDAPYLFDTRLKTLTEQNSLACLYHFSHFIRPGAVRIGSSAYTEKLEVTAVENQDNYVVIMLNRTGENMPVALRINGEIAVLSVAPESIVSGVIPKQ